jgi:sialate O-acetylesterase
MALRAATMLMLTATGHAALTVSNTLGSNMVLQRGKPAPIWGWTTPGSTVSVGFGGGKLSATAAPGAGLWKVHLPAQEASLVPKVITITAGADTVSLENVLFGDVILCSGQSK